MRVHAKAYKRWQARRKKGEPAPLALAMTEADLQELVIKAALLNGWKVYHAYDSRKSTGEGFPDLVLARAGDPPIFAELKAQGETAEEEQVEWGEVLEASPGAEYYLWYPRDLDTQIFPRLQRKRSHEPTTHRDPTPHRPE